MKTSVIRVVVKISFVKAIVNMFVVRSIVNISFCNLSFECNDNFYKPVIFEDIKERIKTSKKFKYSQKLVIAKLEGGFSV